MTVTSLEDWSEIVRADLTRAVDGLIAAGRHLRAAKAEHRGHFKAWIDSGAINIGYRQAARLMAIAERLDDLPGDTACHLPKDTLVLYELAVHLDRDQLTEAVASGNVHPALNREAARALIAQLNNAYPDEVASLELVQQTWTPRRGYFPSPKPPPRKATPAPVKHRPTPPVWARLVATGDLDVAALDRGDVDEWAKLAAAVDAMRLAFIGSDAS